MERLIKEGPEGIGQVFTGLFGLAMRLERERYLEAGPYERGPERRGRVARALGRASVYQVCHTAGH